ncbi:MAG TPA: hypothetical protein VLB09_07205 [Nitrospiria bacterium]|nr:hypothetical protein [Nitrospiria bacterium]
MMPFHPAKKTTGRRRLEFAASAGLLFLLMTAGCGGAQTQVDWEEGGPPTPARMTLKEIDRTTLRDFRAVVYKIQTEGLPQGELYTLWGKKMNSNPVRLAQVRLTVDATGRIMAHVPAPNIPMPSGSSIHLPPSEKEFVFNASGFARGEPFEISLLDSRMNIRATTRAVPFPIESAGEGPCRLQVELASAGGDFFSVIGIGFKPNEEVLTISSSNSSVLENRRLVNTAGGFVASVNPRVPGKESGTAEYRVKGGSCQAAVQYAWGTAALQVE